MYSHKKIWILLIITRNFIRRIIKRAIPGLFIIFVILSPFFWTTLVKAEENPPAQETRFSDPYYVYIPLVLMPAIKNGGFESGNDGSWELFALWGWTEDIIYQPLASDSVQPYEGKYLAWLGGLQEEITQISQTVLIKEGKTNLNFWYWVESSDLCNPDYGYDYFRVKINGSPIFELPLCPDINSTNWQNQVLSLDPYINSAVELLFEVMTNETSTSDEYGSNLYLDQISIQ